MKLKNIMLGLGVALSLGLMSNSYADIIVHNTTNLKDVDLCDQVQGLWRGEGIVSLGLKCKYKGTADIKKSGATSLQIQIVLDKESGLFCPDHEDLPLTGICKNSTIIIETSKAHLKGDLKESGHAAKVTGSITYIGLPLNVDIDLRK